MSLTTDPQHPDLGPGAGKEPGPQNKTYLVLSEEERAKGFKRPVLLSYRHVGSAGPRWPLRDLTSEEHERYDRSGYAKYEACPAGDHPTTGRFWTQADLDKAGKGCGTVTTMNLAIAKTCARDPDFYGATYCCGCRLHLPVGAAGEFTWIDQHGQDTGERVGT